MRIDRSHSQLWNGIRVPPETRSIPLRPDRDPDDRRPAGLRLARGAPLTQALDLRQGRTTTLPALGFTTTFGAGATTRGATTIGAQKLPFQLQFVRNA